MKNTPETDDALITQLLGIEVNPSPDALDIGVGGIGGAEESAITLADLPSGSKFRVGTSASDDTIKGTPGVWIYVIGIQGADSVHPQLVGASNRLTDW